MAEVPVISESMAELNTRDRIWVSEMGCSHVTNQRIASSSVGSNASIAFNIYPNSPRSFISRGMLLECTIDFTITGTNSGGNNLLQPNRFGLRSMSSVFSSSQVTINSQTFTDQTMLWYHILPWMVDASDLSSMLSVCNGAYPDTVQNYADADGTLFNPLNGVSEMINQTQSQRGIQPNMRVLTNTPTSAHINVTFYEYMTVSPITPKDVVALTNLTNFVINLQLLNLARLLCISPASGSTISNVISQVQQSYMEYTEYTPLAIVTIPPVVSYSYSLINIYQSSSNGPVANGANFSITSNTLNISTVPSKIILFIKETYASISSSVQSLVSTPEAYAEVLSVSMFYGNTSALLASASQRQLYEMSRKNHIRMTYPQWIGRSGPVVSAVGPTVPFVPLTGSIVVIDMSRDIDTDMLSTPGTVTQANLYFTVTARNNSGRTINYELNVMTVNDSMCQISPGSALKYDAIITKAQQATATITESSAEATTPLLSGQGKFGEAIKKGWTYAKPALSVGLDVFGKRLGITDKTRESVRDVYGFGGEGGAMVKKSSLKHRYR